MNTWVFRRESSDPDGTPVEVHPKLAAHFAGPTPSPPARATHTDSTGDRWAVASTSIRAGNRELVVLLLVPLKEGDAELALLARVLAAAVPLALLVSGAVAYLLARKAAAPVDALRRSAEAITVERLHDRLPVPNPDDELGKLATTVNAMIARSSGRSPRSSGSRPTPRTNSEPRSPRFGWKPKPRSTGPRRRSTGRWPRAYWKSASVWPG